MISTIKGNLLNKIPSKVVIDCFGIGFEFNISLKTYGNLPEIGNEVFLYALHFIREDKIELYGFGNDVEKSLFIMLNSVSGIGPKVALGILSSIEPSELYNAIASENLNLLTKLPGIGKKTAERLLLELRDKVNKQFIASIDSDIKATHDIRQEAVMAMQTLGYSLNISDKAVNAAIKELGSQSSNLELLIRTALKSVVS